MNWLASPHWAGIVKALLHTLWQGGIIAGLVALVLIRTKNPVTRYRCLFAGLWGILFAGLVTWSALDRSLAPAPVPPATSPTTAGHLPYSSEPPLQRSASPAPNGKSPPLQPWTAWMAAVWMAGMALMLARAVVQVAGAERLRLSSSPVEDARVSILLSEVRAAVGLAQRVRLAATDQLTSPAVVGVLAPTLIIPLSLLTTLTPAQIRFVLLHELAHIKRGDYFANLFQLILEALLFFNPAVWWLSRNLRIEREACCDLLAVELSGAPAEYSRTLLQVAENVLSPAPLAAAAFGDRREPSSLLDRVRRMLVPGYRPKLRLTWTGFCLGLLGGAGLLLLSAIGTNLAVSAILTPQQRIARIENKMRQYGVKAGVEERSTDFEDRVTVRALVRTRDGSPLPARRQATVHSLRRGSSSSYGTTVAEDGAIRQAVQAGQVWVETVCDGFAPSVVGPFDATATNSVDAGELVLDPGFDIQLTVSDGSSGTPVTNATLQAGFITREAGLTLHRNYDSTPDSSGKITFHHGLDQPLQVTVKAPDYEIVDQRFERPQPGQPLDVKLKLGAVVEGQVIDKATGVPIQGAAVRVIYEEGHQSRRYEWTDSLRFLTESDASGNFVSGQLKRGAKYWLGVSAPGHESAITPGVVAGLKGLIVKLGPELVVRGRVVGGLEGLQVVDGNPCLSRTYSEIFDNHSYGKFEWVPLSVTNGVANFVFTNPVPAIVKLSGAGYQDEREVSSPIADWVVVRKLEAPVQTSKVWPKRDVVFRFKHPSGVHPTGSVSVTIPEQVETGRFTAHSEEREIKGGEVRAEIPIGGRTSIEPKRMIGFWFDGAGRNGRLVSIEVTNGPGPMVIEIPLIQAGAIYARARNADGTPAGGLFFGLREIKRAPGREASNSLGDNGDDYSIETPRKWVSGPLPLGGTYQVHAWRGNSFCMSQPVKLTEQSPDAEVELQFSKAQTFEGVVLGADGQLSAGAEIRVLFTLKDAQTFILLSVFSDERGHFQIDNMTPDAGEYSAGVYAPASRCEFVPLNFASQPQIIRCAAGRKLGGHIVEAGTGRALPGAEVQAFDMGRQNMARLTARTDADGSFEFTSMGDGEYTFYVPEGQLASNRTFRADGSTSLVLSVKLNEWSRLRAKSPPGALPTTVP